MNRWSGDGLLLQFHAACVWLLLATVVVACAAAQCNPKAPGPTEEHSYCAEPHEEGICVAVCKYNIRDAPADHNVTYVCKEGKWKSEIFPPMFCADGNSSSPRTVWLDNEVYYRLLTTAWTWAGALQRAANEVYGGLQGHMAAPLDAHEDAIIRFVGTLLRAPTSYMGFDKLGGEAGSWVAVHNTKPIVTNSRYYLDIYDVGTNVFGDPVGELFFEAQTPNWNFVDGPAAGQTAWTGTCNTTHVCCEGSSKMWCGNLPRLAYKAPNVFVEWAPHSPDAGDACVYSTMGGWRHTSCSTKDVTHGRDPATTEPKFYRVQFTVVQFRGGYTKSPSHACGPRGICDCKTSLGNMPRTNSTQDIDRIQQELSTIVGGFGKIMTRAGIICRNSMLLEVPIFDANPLFDGVFVDLAKGIDDRLGIDLSYNVITHVATDQFLALTTLKSIDLSNNNLLSVPRLRHPTLEELFITDNYITVVEVGTFAFLPRLQFLKLSPENFFFDYAETVATFCAEYDNTADLNNLNINHTLNGNLCLFTTTQPTTTSRGLIDTAQTDEGKGGDSTDVVVIAVAVVIAVVIVVGVTTVVIINKRSRRRKTKHTVMMEELTTKVQTLADQQFHQRYHHIFNVVKFPDQIERMKSSTQRGFADLRVDPSVITRTQMIAPGVFSGFIKHHTTTTPRQRTLPQTQPQPHTQPQPQLTQTPVHLKIVTGMDRSLLSECLVEAKLLHALRHPHIVGVVAIVDHVVPMMFATETVGDTLKQYLKKVRPSTGTVTCTPTDLIKIAAQLASACEFLEFRRLIHRSLGSDQAVVSLDGRLAKLSNLGEARGVYQSYQYVSAVQRNEKTKERLAVRWMAPESIRDGLFTSKTDCWSFGVLLWEMATYGKTPYGAFTTQEISNEVLEGRRLQPPSTCTSRMASLMSSCWRPQPSRRPTFGEIREHLNLQSTTAGLRLLEEQDNAKKLAVSQFDITLVAARLVQTVKPISRFGGFSVLLLQRNDTKEKLIGVCDVDNRKAEMIADIRILQCISNATQFLRCVGETQLKGHGYTYLMRSGPCGAVVCGSLLDVEIPETKRVNAVLDVALALEHLHAANVVLKWLNPAICMVTSDYSVVLLVTGTKPVTSALKTKKIAPEVINEMKDLSWWHAPETLTVQELATPSNVFTFGTMLWSIYHPSKPGAPQPRQETFGLIETMTKHLLDGHGLDELKIDNETMPGYAVDVLRSCHDMSPSNRPRLSAVVTSLLDGERGANRWEVDPQHLLEVRALGSGQFGDVVLAVFVPDDEDTDSTLVAVKTLKAPTDATTAQNEEMRKEFVNELELMKRLRHPNLVTLFGCVTKGEPMSMVLEYLPGGSLEDWLEENAEDLQNKTVVEILRQVSHGMIALGQHGVIHRDLAARNVLVGTGTQVKVADYGMSRDLQAQDYYKLHSNRMLPLRWTAPDIFLDMKWTVATDVYSFGVLVSEVYSGGELPFDSLEDDTFVKHLTGTQPLHELLVFSHKELHAPTIIRDLVKRCVSRSVKERPTFMQIAEELSIAASQNALVGRSAQHRNGDDAEDVDDYLEVETSARHSHVGANTGVDFDDDNTDDSSALTFVTNRSFA
eukprot:m.250154 g.250154  ORF g.250154 m.250154 type:complete len:1592 (-) comp33882_c0_seq2:48-4823(-)